MEKQIIFDFYNTLYNPKTGKLFRGVYKLLSDLRKNYRLCLITTTSKDREEQINRLKIKKYFAKIILCQGKTITIFKKVTKQFPNTIVVGDREEEELLIAKSLQLEAILINSFLENPCFSIRKSLKEITL